MKKYYTNLFLTLFIAAAFTACNKDDDESDKYPGVPTGSIVPIEERAFVLTGADDPDLKATDDLADDYKFWTFESSKAFISGCGESDEIDLLAELGGSEVPEIAFAPDGNIMARVGDDISDSYSDWEWADADKSGIILDKFPNVTFEFTALNERQVVYASIQNITYEDCDYKVITYEELIR
jgi:hypothetical protein